MEFWPADFRPESTATLKKRRKGKEVYVNDPCLEVGTLGAATLTAGRGQFEWTTLAQSRAKTTLRYVGVPLEIFPSTKLPPVNLPKLTVHQRAEQGARFLRTYHPDVDVPFELIKDELESDEEEAAADSALNPYAGNSLAHFSITIKRKGRTSFLAFPYGETGSTLNVSPFRVTRDKTVVFTPLASSISSFDTPIQQVAPFPCKSDANCKFALLAVRAHSTVSVIKLQGASVQADVPSISATTVTPIVTSDTGNHRVVDMSCSYTSSSNAQVMLVNDTGAVYTYKVDGEKMTLVVPPNVPETEEPEVDQFWRIVRKEPNVAIRTSNKRVHLFDVRASNTPSLQLFHLTEPGEYMTSIEAPLEGLRTMCFATTNKLVWFDDRNLISPILSFKHQRAFDRSLRAETVLFGTSALATVSSRANRLVTVYDVNYGSSGHIHLYGEPSMLTGPSDVELPVVGSVFFRHPTEEDSVPSLFQLSSRGSIWKTNIIIPSETVDMAGAKSNIEALEWTEEVQALAQNAKTMAPEIGNLGGREFLNANLRGAYEKIFQVRHDGMETLEGDAEAVYQTLEKMPFFWQDLDAPAEHMLTTFDIAFQSGLEPVHASRADFLTKSLLSSPQGYAALALERIPIQRLASIVHWHYDLSSMPQGMVPDISLRSLAFIGQLREEALAHASTPEAMKRATEAAQNLALDLALARHIYAPRSFISSRAGAASELEDSNLLLQATKAMSLGTSEPPPVRFGFLQPLIKVPRTDEQMESADESSDVGQHMPLGVRLLISDWEIGADPGKYVYKDPYEEDTAVVSRKPGVARNVGPADDKEAQRTQHESIPTIISVPRPPLVVTTSRPAPTWQRRIPPRTASMLESTDLPATSSPGVAAYNQSASQSQLHTLSSQVQLGPSTQPLPGPFGGGGRQIGMKKKTVKKRMGGF